MAETHEYVVRLFGHGLNEDEVGHMFTLIQEQGAVETVFYNGDVKSAGDLVWMASQPGCGFYGIYLKGKPEPLACSWINQADGKGVRIHFCGFRACFREHAVGCGKAMTRFLLEAKEKDEHMLDVLVGVTPENNRLALRFIKQLGFRRVGVVPGAVWLDYEGRSVPGVVSYLTRKEL